ncbi:bifunctional hydroxymethylpyrimidine kinase/phosphomethylpyrimidine kinase [Orrella sp. JC864]|uniref:bifunctional hydroxymethylpyrimidine kinase/phosphomethylpyrimidine kinase n=1 Tax=Orrella sp. JC864 TaxID=3120298 RepID=UPI003008FE06
MADPLLPPLVLLFGPVDPTGADGLPGDAVTCAALGAHGLAVPTALTVQDSANVEDVTALTPDQIDDQARCLLEDMAVQAIKVGALHTPEAVSAVAQIAADYSHLPLVLHLGGQGRPPAGAADHEQAEDVLGACFELLLPQADVVVVEHTRLAGWHAEGLLETNEPSDAYLALLAAGADWVLTLGHALQAGHRNTLLSGPDQQTATWPWQAPAERTGDSGGVLAAALAAWLAHGLPMPQAAERAIAYADAALGAAFRPGMGLHIARRMIHPDTAGGRA